MNRIYIKKSWKEITIKDYRKIVDITNREFDSTLEKDIATLAVLSDINEDELYSYNINTLAGMLNEMKWVNEPFTFNKNWKPGNMVINGRKCKVNPDIDSLTVAQYMDFQIFWGKRDTHMGNLLAVFIIPEGYKYNEGYDAVEFADELERTLSICDYNSICFFLLKNWLISIKASLLYSDWKMRRMKTPEAKDLRKQIQKAIRSMDFSQL